MARGTVIFIWIMILLVAAVAGTWAWRYYTAEIRGVITAKETIQSGPYRIAKYDHFFDQCASIQGFEGKLDAQLAQLDSLKDVDASEKELRRVTTNIAGLQGMRAAAIRQYNADARKEGTAGQFRDSSLPHNLPTDNYDGEKTSCE